jgi:hypothetical protein
LGVFGDFALDAWGDFEDFGDLGDLLVLALGDFDEGLTGELVEGDGFSRFRMSTVREGERARVITGLGDARGLAGMWWVGVWGVGVWGVGVVGVRVDVGAVAWLSESGVMVRLGELVLATPFETMGLLFFTTAGGGGGFTSSSSSSSVLPPNIFSTSNFIVIYVKRKGGWKGKKERERKRERKRERERRENEKNRKRRRSREGEAEKEEEGRSRRRREGVEGGEGVEWEGIGEIGILLCASKLSLWRSYPSLHCSPPWEWWDVTRTGRRSLLLFVSRTKIPLWTRGALGFRRFASRV